MDNLPVFPLDHLPMFGMPEAPALVIRERVYNYQELNLRVGRLATWLASRDVSAGDRVATWLAKGEVACLMPLACVRAGLVHVPVNPMLKFTQVFHIMKDCSAKILITNTSRAESLVAGTTGQTKGHVRPYHIADEKELLLELDDGNKIPASPVSDMGRVSDLAAILYTSGSTGLPKGVMLSNANLSLGAVSVAQYLSLAPDDVTLAALPLSFDYGQNQLLSTWSMGGCVVPLDYLTPRDIIKACARYKVTTLAGVPPLWVQLVEQKWPTDASTNIRRLTNSGGALTPSLVKQLRAIFGRNTEIYAMYGLTEAFRSTYLDPALIDGNPTSIGKAIPYAEIMVVSGNGSETVPGEAGELVHAGPLVAQGYWKDDQRTAQRFRPAPGFSSYGGQAVWSGDTVRRDADGLLYFVGRDDAMIKTSGNRVSPTEVEEVAIESGLVAEACVVGRKDERLGEAIVLFVRKSGVENEELLRAYLKANLPNFMQPAQIIWLESLPKGANGKLDRNSLAASISA